MVGFPGSGKTTLAKKLSTVYKCHYFSSDEIREKLFGTKRFDKSGDEIIQQQSRQAYEYMYRLAATLLRQNQKIILDATHLETAKRQTVVQQLLAVVPAQRLTYIVVNPPVDQITQRMARLGDQMHQDWREVYDLFLDKQRLGLLSWPTAEEGIECIAYDELTQLLEK